MNQQLGDDPPEGVNPEVLADLIVEEAVEETVEQDDRHQGEGQEEHEVVDGALNE